MKNEQLITKMLDHLRLNQGHHEKLKRYYLGDHDILHSKTAKDPLKADMRAYFNYCRKMVQNSVGYLLGKPVNYGSKTENKEFISNIDYYFSNWEHAHNIKLKIEASIHGYAYEANYINSEGDFECAAYSPLEMIVLHDGTIENKVSLAIRKYKVQFDETEYVEVWDDTFYSNYKLSGGKLLLLERKRHRFSRCPVRELKNNDIKKSTFEDIIKIIDMYNAIHANAANELVDHRNSYLVFTNCNVEFEDAKKMKENGIIILPHDKAEVKWLTKDLHGTFVKDMLKQWQDEMYIQSNQVNLNENFQSNTSGVSIRLKLQELENQSAIAESHFEKVLKDRLKFFCEFLYLKKQAEFDYKDVNVAFTRNVPVDEVAIAQMVSTLSGLVPHEDLLSRLPFIQNPSASMQKLIKQHETVKLHSANNMNTTAVPKQDISDEEDQERLSNGL
ncbi:phage portal protein [Bacillus subtilis]|uniref:phage portal protein n=1 Tax=Bacillus subtilis TaxID=1423 RepID=UPI003EB6AD7F